MAIRHAGHVYTILDFHVAQSGMQRPTVHLKLRELRSGKPSDRTLDQISPLEEAPTERREMQFLYSSGAERVFMDNEAFEQYSFGVDFLDEAVDFLVAGGNYRFLVVEGKVASIELPPIVPLEVTDTAPVAPTGGSSNVFKEATMNSGIVIRVPLFIKTGDRIRVKTEPREYASEEH